MITPTAQSTKSSIMEIIFDDVVYSLSSSPFEIRMVITQSLFDGRIKNSSHIDENSVEITPFRA